MPLRHKVLIITDILLVFFLICLILTLVRVDGLQRLYAGIVNVWFYAALCIGGMLMCLVVYVIVFQLKTLLARIWLHVMLVVWHLPLILIVYTLFRARALEIYWDPRWTVLPALFTAMWTIQMLVVYKLRLWLAEFDRLACEIRESASLMAKTLEAKKRKGG